MGGLTEGVLLEVVRPPSMLRFVDGGWRHVSIREWNATRVLSGAETYCVVTV